MPTLNDPIRIGDLELPSASGLPRALANFPDGRTGAKFAPVDSGRPNWRRPMSVPAKVSSRKADSELLIAIAAGNRRALEDLYLGYQGRLARFLSRFTRRHENIEEIINDTFMVVWCNANDFRFASQVSSWIFGIAYRTALKSIRRQQNHSAGRSLEECPEQTVDPVLETEIQDWVTHGLNRLPDEQRLALELACHMGHSSMEIAEITGAPIGTVKARMFHARQKLRQYLQTVGSGICELSAMRAAGHQSASRKV
jgi:RNA polymerase sigma-70 factor, ECF subfamily